MPNFDPMKKRETEDILKLECKFPKYHGTGMTWADILEDDPEYIVFLFDNNKLDDEFEDLYEEAREVIWNGE